MLIATLCGEAVRFSVLYLRRGRRPSLADRARWLSDGSARILRNIGFRFDVRGIAPERGLIASNHLSHIDVLCYASAYRCIFVAKYEVKDWFFFGWFARTGGTVFVQRERAADAVRAGRDVGAALAEGVPVMLFPEGTSTDGSGVLPFHPLLFEPAVRAAGPITASAIGYSARDAEERELCYYGDIEFGPHLLHCLGLRDVQATMIAGRPATYGTRKEAAAVTEAEVLSLRAMLRAGSPARSSRVSEAAV